MLGKIFIALFWLAFISEIFYAIACCKKYFGSTKIRSHEPDTSTIVCSVSTSILAILVAMFFIFASKDTKEAFRSDPLLGYLAIPINQIALVSFMFIGVFSYYMEKQISYSKHASKINVGDLSDFDDYEPSYDKTTVLGQTVAPSQILTPSQTATVTSDPTFYENPNHKNTDNGAAELYILQLDGGIKEQLSFDTLSDARAHMNKLESGGIVITTKHTRIFNLKGCHTDATVETCRAFLKEFVRYLERATVIKEHYRNHYLEITKGLWKDEEFDDGIENAFTCAIDNGDSFG